jgi:hypothetical protein
MSKTRFFQILFSLAVIAALALSAAPAPAYALSASNANPAQSASAVHQISATAMSPDAVVCRVVTVRHNGRVIRILRCHKIIKPV